MLCQSRKSHSFFSHSQYKRVINHHIGGICIRTSHINFASACVNIFLLSQIINRRVADESLAFPQNVYHTCFKLFIGETEL